MREKLEGFSGLWNLVMSNTSHNDTRQTIFFEQKNDLVSLIGIWLRNDTTVMSTGGPLNNWLT